MGVTGLWRLLEPCGQPVPTEFLTNKTVAIDVSIWLNQAMKGYRDSNGHPLPNAHLLCVFHRVCKLLAYRVRPVFVFDGGVPSLKYSTLAERRLRKQTASGAAERAGNALVQNLLKQHALREVMGEDTGVPIEIAPRSTSQSIDMFHLPSPKNHEDDENDSISSASASDSEADDIIGRLGTDLHSFDFDAAEFHALPSQVKHDILSELKDTRKQSSWGKMHEMPTDSGDFSEFQMNRLLKRKKFQDTIGQVEAEITRRNTELLHLGIDMSENLSVRRMASKADTYLVMGQLNSPRKDTKSEAKLSDEVQNNDDNDELKKSSDKDVSSTDCQERNDLQYSSKNACTKEDGSSQVRSSDVSHLSCSTVNSKHAVAPNLNPTSQFSNACGTEPSSCYNVSDLLNVKSPCEDKTFFEKAVVAQTSIWSHDENKAVKRIKFDEPEVEHESSMSGFVDTKKRKMGQCITECINPKDPSLSSSAGDKSTMSSFRIKVDHQCFRREDDMFEDVFGDDSVKSFGGQIVNTPEDKFICDQSNENVVNIREENLEGVMSDCESSLDADLDEVSNSSHTVMNTQRSTDDSLSSSAHVQQIDSCDSFSMKLKDNGQFVNVTNLSENTLKVVNAVELDYDTEAQNNGVISLDSESKMSFVEQNNRNEPIVEKNSTEHCIVNEDSQFYMVPCELIDETPGQSSEFSESNKKRVTDTITDTKQIYEVQNEDERDKYEEFVVDAVDSANQDIEPGSSDEEVFPKEDFLTDEHLRGMASDLCNEQFDLLKERGRQERLAASVNDQMYADIQNMLQLFGIPYVVAPMEAEAQCAFLETAGLTSGTITDDSDIWLFGGRLVYKNFFNQNRHVERYKVEDIERILGVAREHLICIALLTGSDYTTGVEGVGCVRALEILAEFPGDGLNSLRKFKDWWCEIRKSPNSNSLKALRRTLASLQLSEGFPSGLVAEAYLKPEVDSNREPFSWAEPDFDGLRQMAASKMGWSSAHTESILQPVIKRMTSGSVQTSLHQFFDSKMKEISPRKQSKRLKLVTNKIIHKDSLPIQETAVANNDNVEEKTDAKSQINRQVELKQYVEDIVWTDDELDEELANVNVEVDNKTKTEQITVQIENIIPAHVSESSKSSGTFSGNVRFENIARPTNTSIDVDCSEGCNRQTNRIDNSSGSSFVNSDIVVSRQDVAPHVLSQSVSGSVLDKLSDAESLRRLQLVQNMRLRANRVKATLQTASDIDSVKSSRRPVTTRGVRDQMYKHLLKTNPRMRAERTLNIVRSSMALNSASTTDNTSSQSASNTKTKRSRAQQTCADRVSLETVSSSGLSSKPNQNISIIPPIQSSLKESLKPIVSVGLTPPLKSSMSHSTDVIPQREVDKRKLADAKRKAVQILSSRRPGQKKIDSKLTAKVTTRAAANLSDDSD